MFRVLRNFNQCLNVVVPYIRIFVYTHTHTRTYSRYSVQYARGKAMTANCLSQNGMYAYLRTIAGLSNYSKHETMVHHNQQHTASVTSTSGNRVYNTIVTILISEVVVVVGYTILVHSYLPTYLGNTGSGISVI